MTLTNLDFDLATSILCLLSTSESISFVIPVPACTCLLPSSLSL